MVFESRRPDGLTDWQVIYDAIKDAPIGHVFTYDDLDGIIGRPFLPTRPGIYRAIEELRLTRQRSMGNVAGVGYRVLHPTEHPKQASGYRKRSRRHLGTAIEVIQAADLEMLGPDDIRRVQAQSVTLGQLAQVFDFLVRRQKAVERQLGDVVERQERTDTQIEAILKMLREAGITPPNPE